MNVEEFREHGKEMVDYICDYVTNMKQRRVFPDVSPGYLRLLLPSQAPREPEKWSAIQEDVERLIMPGITHWQHPDFHAYFPTGNSFPSILGDMLSNAIGCVGFSWAASPACTELEIVMADWLVKMLGLPTKFLHSEGKGGGGVIQTSASDCLLVSMLTARRKAIEERCDPAKVDPPLNECDVLHKLVGYCSDLAHSCVEKAGLISFVQIRQLELDDNYSMRGSVLQEAVENDIRLGLIPFFVCASLGTTGCCSFDTLDEIGLVCKKYNMWMHVDAAYAGASFVCPELRAPLKGIEYANSMNFNPIKWMFVNIDCSILWMEDTNALTQSMTVDQSHLQHKHSSQALDFQHWGIHTSRRFRALKLWFVIRTYGLVGIRSYIREETEADIRFAWTVIQQFAKETIAAESGKLDMVLEETIATDESITELPSKRKESVTVPKLQEVQDQEKVDQGWKRRRPSRKSVTMMIGGELHATD